MKKAGRADVRALTVLCFIEGAVSLIKLNHVDPVIYNKVEYVEYHCKTATTGWPINQDSKATHTACAFNMARIKGRLDNIWWLKVKEEMNYPGLAYVALQLLDDLMTLVKNKEKSLMLQNIYDGLEVLTEYADPEGKMYLTQDRAQEIVGSIYEVVGES